MAKHIDNFKEYKRTKIDSLMTQEEMVRVNDYLAELIDNRGNNSAMYSDWDKYEKDYLAEQEMVPGMPNSRINVFHANIEGQVAAIVDQNITVTTRGQSPGDEIFADWGRICLDWTLRKNRIKQVLGMGVRRFLKFGPMWLKVMFDPKAFNGFGLTKICNVPPNKIYVDHKIRDPLRYQEAEYIDETINLSRTYAIDTYGEDKANAIDYGRVDDSTTFWDDDFTQDDEDSWILIQRWSRYKGTLRLEEFSHCGVLLYDSHKEGDRKTNQKSKPEKHESYYTDVNDNYPYFLSVCYPEEGKLIGFGDGKLMHDLQKLINELYDKIRVCARPNLVLFDTSSDVDLSDYDENSLEPRPFDGDKSKEPVKTYPWGTINESWWRLLAQIHQEFQRVTRFSDLMIGQGKSSDTATESAIQQQQGNMTTNYKKLVIQDMLVQVCEYALGVMLQMYDGAKAFRLSDDKAEYQWVDFKKMKNAPIMMPPESGFEKQYTEQNGMAPQWQLLEEGGKVQTKRVELDIDINIGAGLPSNESFLMTMAEKLSQLVILDKTGVSRPAMSWEEVRKFLSDVLGLPLDDDEEMKNAVAPMPQGVQGNTQMPNPSAMGLGANGSPAMGNLSMIRGGANGVNSPT